MTQFHNISVNIRFNFPCNSITVCEWNSVASRRAIMTTMDETCRRKVVSLKTLEWLSIGIFLNRSVNYLREMLASKWKFSFDRKLIHAIFNLLSFDLFLLLVLRILLRLTRAKNKKLHHLCCFSSPRSSLFFDEARLPIESTPHRCNRCSLYTANIPSCTRYERSDHLLCTQNDSLFKSDDIHSGFGFVFCRRSLPPIWLVLQSPVSHWLKVKPTDALNIERDHWYSSYKHKRKHERQHEKLNAMNWTGTRARGSRRRAI